MNKILLAFIIVTGAGSLHGMELSKQLSPITLPQTYHHLSECMLPEIAQHIFSLQLGTSSIDIVKNDPGKFVKLVETLFNSCGYDLTIKICEQLLHRAKLSMCDFRDNHNWTPLYFAVDNKEPIVIKILMELAGENVWTLLTTKDAISGRTVLHWAANLWFCPIQIVKLFLDVAGDKARMLLKIQDSFSQTPLELAWENRNEAFMNLTIDVIANKNI